MNITTDMISISIVIPVYNAEFSIGSLVYKLVSELKHQYNLEIVLVNDNSKANSKEVCIGLYERYRSCCSK